MRVDAHHPQAAGSCRPTGRPLALARPLYSDGRNLLWRLQEKSGIEEELFLVVNDKWLEVVGRNGWCAIIRDKKIRRRPSENAALERFRVGVVNVIVRRNLTSSGYVDLLERNWHRLEEVLAEPPAYYHLTKGGVAKLHKYPI